MVVESPNRGSHCGTGHVHNKKMCPRLSYVKCGTSDIAHRLRPQYEQIYILVVLHGAIMQHRDVSTMCSLLYFNLHIIKIQVFALDLMLCSSPPDAISTVDVVLLC